MALGASNGNAMATAMMNILSKRRMVMSLLRLHSYDESDGSDPHAPAQPTMVASSIRLSSQSANKEMASPMRWMAAELYPLKRLGGVDTPMLVATVDPAPHVLDDPARNFGAA
jgi:hypothetical protein